MKVKKSEKQRENDLRSLRSHDSSRRDEAKDHLSRRRLDRRGVCARNILEEDFPHFFYTLDYGITISYETLMKELPLF